MKSKLLSLFFSSVFWLLSGCASAQPTEQTEQNYGFAAAAEYAAGLSGHSVLILIDGEVVFEEYQNGYSADKATHLHSATKSFWGPVVAAMIADGLISSFDERVSDTIVEWKKDAQKNEITVRELLNLSAGLYQDVPNLQGDGAAKNKYQHAVGVRMVAKPGSEFQYGPAPYYVLGELISRKVEGKYKDPLDYLIKRLLDPLGIQVSDWKRDPSGNPHIPNGAYLTARNWAKYGQFLLQGGLWEGKQIIPRDLLAQCFQPSPLNPGYGFTFWLNHPGGFSERLSSSTTTAGGFIYPDGFPEIYGAFGAGTNDLFVVPSLNMVIVHQSEVKGSGHRDQLPAPPFSRARFLSLLFTGQSTSMTQPGLAGQTSAGADRGDGLFDRLDRNRDGRLSFSEIPSQASKLKSNFNRLDRNQDGSLTPDELSRSR